MQANKEAADVIGRGVHIANSQTELKSNPTNNINNVKYRLSSYLSPRTPVILHYVTLTILGFLTWGLLWFIWGDSWNWNGIWFRLVVVACIAWACGLSCQSLTSLPPQLPALLVGILARNLEYIDMRDHPSIDILFRKVVPVVILGKASLMWDFDYMKTNWLQVASLGIMPWTAEISTVAIFTHFILGFPWSWGFSFGAFYACVSIPIVVPVIMQLPMSMAQIRGWMQLLCNSGGVDVSLSIVTYGMIKSVMATNVSDLYRYIRLVLTPFVGILLGTIWGYLASVIPHPQDYYVIELRILFVLVGGFFVNFLAIYLDWGGTALLSILICNAIAIKHWIKGGWHFLNNPATTGYRSMWSACEPALFAYTGTFFAISNLRSDIVINSLLLLLLCLVVRLSVVAIVCWKKTLKERLFICCCWSPKAIVQAVICPIRITNFIVNHASDEDKRYADDVLTMTIIAILITTPLSFLSTKYLAPILLKDAIQEKKPTAGP